MASEKIKNVKINNGYWNISVDIHFPPNFDEKKKYPAIISAHPIGSCKEQTSGNVYGEALAKEGFVVGAYSALENDPLLDRLRATPDFVELLKSARYCQEPVLTRARH